MGMYVSGLYLTVPEHEKANQRSPKGNAAEHALKIKMARARVEELAKILNPFSFEVLKDLIDKIKGIKEDILIDLNYQFDARQLASGYINPALLTQVATTEQLAAMSIQLPVVYQQPVIQQPAVNAQWSISHNMKQQPNHSNWSVSDNGMMNIPQDDSNVAQWMKQLENKMGTNDQIIFQKFDPAANILEWMDFLYKKRDVEGYKSSKDTLVRFFKAQGIKTQRYGKKDNEEEDYIPFFALTKPVLEKMEAWMYLAGVLKKDGTTKPMAISTTRTYMSYIKATYEYCIGCRLLPEDLMPIGGSNELNKYSLPSVPERDISFSDEQFTKFLNYKPEKRDETDGRKKEWKLGPYSEEEAHDILKYMYISKGFNGRDFIKKKFNWFDGKGYFTFKRSKMENKKSYTMKVSVQVSAEHEWFIKKYGIKNKNLSQDKYEFPVGPESYVFPVLFKEEKRNKGKKEDGEEKIKLIPITDPKEIIKAGRSFIIQLNRYLKAILEKLDIDAKTSYAIRQQFTNDAIDSGMDSRAVGNDLGHMGKQTIASYMLKKDRKRDVEVHNRLVEKVTKSRTAGQKKRTKTA